MKQEHRQAITSGRPGESKETAMTLTEREKWLMNEAYQAGDGNGASNSANKGRRYTFEQWLGECGLRSNDRHLFISREQQLLIGAPGASCPSSRYWIFAGDMWDAGMDREAAVARAFELARRIGVRTAAREKGDVEIGKWIYLVDASRVQSMELSPNLVDVK